jgi:photosystem II stability/assembly factor-like uncharacterized protein
MGRRHLPIVTLFFSLTLLSVGTAIGDWPGDPDVNVPVVVANESQQDVHLCPDGAGGAIAVWEDYRSGNADVYVQRLSEGGDTLWAATGVAACTESHAQWDPVVCPDGGNGAIVAWRDNRPTTGGIYAQRIDKDGNALWTTNGVVLAAVTNDQEDPRITTDGAGGAIVTWVDERDGPSDVYAQRVSANGSVLWTTNGVPVAAIPDDQYDAIIATDGAGGAFVAWADSRAEGYYIQRLDQEGKALWAANGISIVTHSAVKDDPDMVPDGAGGVVLAFEDRRGADPDIYAQRMDKDGTRIWGTTGVLVNAAIDSQGNPRLIADGTGGAIVVFDDRNAFDEQVYAQRIAANGDSLWPIAGVALCTAEKSQFRPRIVTDGEGGGIVVWTDFRNGSADLYAQRIDADGNPQWTTDGVPVSTATLHQDWPDLVADQSGGAIVAWQDNRVALNDIYAQRIDSEGSLGDGPGLSREYTWTRLGGPNGGLGYDVRIHPKEHAVMYVTDNPSGVNKSLDGGLTWAPSNRGITTRTGPSKDEIPIFCLTVDPVNPSIIWAGTQYDRGIFRSTDGGANWTKKVDGVTEGTEITFRNFAIHPRDSNTVFAGAEITTGNQGRVFDKAKGKIYKSVDGGDHWRAVWDGKSLVRFILFDYANPDIMYACTGIFDREADNTTGVGVLKSVDAGEKWDPANNGISNLFVGYLEMDPSDPATLYAATGNNPLALPPTNQTGEILKTVNGATTWKTLLTGDVFTMVTVSPSDPDIVYAGSEKAIYRSTNGGAKWTTLKKKKDYGYGPAGVRAGFPISGAVHPRDPTTIFVNNYNGGNFKSSDSGETWVDASQGYTGVHLHDIDMVRDQTTTVVTIGRNGPFRSTTSGDSWIGISYAPASFPDWYAVAFRPDDPLTILASDEHQGVLVLTTNGGTKWKEVFRHPSVNSSDPNNRHGFRAIEFSRSNPDIVYAGMARDRLHLDPLSPGASYGMVKSSNGGKSFAAINNGLPMAQLHIWCIAVHPNDPDRAFIGTWMDGLYATTDGGKTWVARNTGLPSLDVRSIAIDPSNPSTIFAGLGEGEGVVKSRDEGNTWAASSKGMTLICPPWLSRVGKVGDGVDLSQPKGLTGTYTSSVPWSSVWAMVVDPSDPNQRDDDLRRRHRRLRGDEGRRGVPARHRHPDGPPRHDRDGVHRERGRFRRGQDRRRKEQGQGARHDVERRDLHGDEEAAAGPIPRPLPAEGQGRDARGHRLARDPRSGADRVPDRARGGRRFDLGHGRLLRREAGQGLPGGRGGQAVEVPGREDGLVRERDPLHGLEEGEGAIGPRRHEQGRERVAERRVRQSIGESDAEFDHDRDRGPCSVRRRGRPRRTSGDSDPARRSVLDRDRRGVRYGHLRVRRSRGYEDHPDGERREEERGGASPHAGRPGRRSGEPRIPPEGREEGRGGEEPRPREDRSVRGRRQFRERRDGRLRAEHEGHSAEEALEEGAPAGGRRVGGVPDRRRLRCEADRQHQGEGRRGDLRPHDPRSLGGRCDARRRPVEEGGSEDEPPARRRLRRLRRPRRGRSVGHSAHRQAGREARESEENEDGDQRRRAGGDDDRAGRSRTGRHGPRPGRELRERRDGHLRGSLALGHDVRVLDRTGRRRAGRRRDGGRDRCEPGRSGGRPRRRLPDPAEPSADARRSLPRRGRGVLPRRDGRHLVHR